MVTYIDPTGTINEKKLEELFSQSPYTILYFYPKNDTPGCTREAQDFTTLTEDFASLGCQIIGVSKDTGESHCQFIKKYSLKPGYIADPDLTLHNQYATRGEKNNYSL